MARAREWAAARERAEERLAMAAARRRSRISMPRARCRRDPPHTCRRQVPVPPRPVCPSRLPTCPPHACRRHVPPLRPARHAAAPPCLRRRRHSALRAALPRRRARPARHAATVGPARHAAARAQPCFFFLWPKQSKPSRARAPTKFTGHTASPADSSHSRNPNLPQYIHDQAIVTA